MNNDPWKDAKWLPYTIAACSAVLLNYLLQRINLVGDLISGLWKVVTPLVLSVILAYLMDPLVLFFQRNVAEKILPNPELFKAPKNDKGKSHVDPRRKLAVLLTVLSIILGIVLLLLNLIPALISSVLSFLENFGDGIISLENKLADLTNAMGAAGLDISQLKQALVTTLENLSGLLNNGELVNRSQAVGSGVATFLVGFILAIYLLLEKAMLVETITALLLQKFGREQYQKIAAFCKDSHDILMQYLGCTILEGIAVGCVNAVFMVIFRMPYVIIVSVIVGVTNLAPTFGPIVGCVLGMFILMLSNPILSLYFLIFTLILQTIDGYVVKPRLFGETLGIRPLLILVSIILGGQLFGVLGILLAIPFSAIADQVVRKSIKEAERNNAAQAGNHEEDPAGRQARVRSKYKSRALQDLDDDSASPFRFLQNVLDDLSGKNTRKSRTRRRRRTDWEEEDPRRRRPAVPDYDVFYEDPDSVRPEEVNSSEEPAGDAEE